MAEKTGKFFARLESIKKHLIEQGVKPEAIQEAYEATAPIKSITGCPTMLSKEIGSLLKDNRVTKFTVFRDKPRELRVVAYKGKRRFGGLILNSANWSVPKNKATKVA